MRFVFAHVFCISVSLASAASAVEIMAGAFSGEPYGIATIEIPLEIPIVGAPLPPLEIRDTENRVHYPVSADIRTKAVRPSEQPVPPPGQGRLLGRLGNLIREIGSGNEELEQTVTRRVMFVFTGDAPLTVQLSDSRRVLGEYQVVPTRDESLRQRQLGDWWLAYTNRAQQQIASADYPPWVETYLVAMLSGRLNQPLPSWFLQDSSADEDQLVNTIKLIVGVEEISNQVFRRAVSGRVGDQLAATLPLPAPPKWVAHPSDMLLDEARLSTIETEPMASRVPSECFYIRYGSFANYMWFLDLANEYGGDISRMITLRGIKDDSAKRIEEQLHLTTTELSRMLGPSVIEDQAIIGRDLYFTEGASLGVMFKSSQPFLLGTSLRNDRSTLESKDDSVLLSDEKIGDRTVSFMRTPDNRVRSFLVEDGEYFFVTNSRTLAQRFLEVGAGGPSLASTTPFRLARQLVPLSRDDTVFAFFSPEMMQGLVDPKYLIELRRRMYAKAEIAMVHLAQLAARNEGQILQSADELVQAGYLPQQFGARSDGSGTIIVGSSVLDSSRGRRCNFLPIADASVESATSEESAWYEQIASQYDTRFNQVDPIMFGVRREAVEGAPGIERLIAHAEIAPWDPAKYGKLSQYLGPPTQVAMKFASDDIVAVQAHVASEQLGPPTHLFAAIKDTVPPDPESFDGIIRSYLALREIPGYLGAWPQPGALDRLPLGLGRGQPVGPGMNRLIGGLYRYSGGGFSILSFQPELLEATLPHIAAVDVPDTAQVRLHVGNLAGSQLSNWINRQLYSRADETSRAGASFLNLLSHQLKVPPDQVSQAARDVLGTELQCSLGGEYVFDKDLQRWTSTSYLDDPSSGQVPAGYVAPFMVWFRGMDATLTQYADRLVADTVVDVARKP
jgi:hypothetical protein